MLKSKELSHSNVAFAVSNKKLTSESVPSHPIIPLPFRHNSIHFRINFVTCKKEQITDDAIAVAGDHPQKIEEIVRTILKLRSEDSNVKIIIFSHWDTILNVIASALAENRIEFRTKSVNFHKSIDEFKVSCR